MKRTTYMKPALWFLLGVVTCAVEAGDLFAQTPPSRPTAIGKLELVVSLNGDQPAGVAVSDSGRLFVTFPHHDGNVAFTVAEIKNGQPVAYPSEDLNHPAVDRPSETLFSVQTLQIDASGHLWMLDTGTLQFGEPPLKGAPKLVETDLASNRVIRTVVLPQEALLPNSALKDFRFDFHRGQAGVVFITDSAPDSEGLIVLDLASGQAMRRLTGIAAVSARGARTPIVGYEPLVEMKQGMFRPWLTGLNGLELSADRKTLYFSAFTGRRLYSIPTDGLSNPAVNDTKVNGEVSEMADIGMAGHFSLDANGDLYFMDMEQNAIYQHTPDRHIHAVVVDPRLIWPDTMAIGSDKYLYITTSQHDLRPEFHDGKELRQPPYGLYRVFIGANPVEATVR